MQPSAEHGSLSFSVIVTVADAKGVDPTELPPLHDTVDPDALDALFTTRQDSEGQPSDAVIFTYADRRVMVTRDGQISLED